MNFSEHYSTYTGGGSTFNSDLLLIQDFKHQFLSRKMYIHIGNNVFRELYHYCSKKRDILSMHFI